MNRHLARGSALVGIMGLVAAVQASLTVTPTSHDYGTVGVGGILPKDFRIVLQPGTSNGSKLSLELVGADAQDFGATHDSLDGNSSGCSSGPQGLECVAQVNFSPKTLGPKQASLVVSDNRGATVRVPLTGKAVQPVCTNRVVFCNYAHLYSGTFGWTYSIISPSSQTNVHVQVDITNGVAVCNGAETIAENGRSTTGAITGKGLVAVEWLLDDMYPFVYRITAACPTPDYPAGPNGEAATPSQPAELGHNDMTSDKQPDPWIKPGMTLEHVVTGLYRLQGTLSYPAPETDQSNGVSGNVVITWNLVRS